MRAASEFEVVCLTVQNSVAVAIVFLLLGPLYCPALPPARFKRPHEYLLRDTSFFYLPIPCIFFLLSLMENSPVNVSNVNFANDAEARQRVCIYLPFYYSI